MKTMRIIFPALLLFSVMVGNSCSKEVEDITQYKWTLKSITTNGKTTKPPMEYVLCFSNDSMFCMHLSVNEAGGCYRINLPDKIKILSYHSFTEVCCESDFDNLLLSSFINANTYSMKGDSLVFKRDDNEKLTFTKK